VGALPIGLSDSGFTESLGEGWRARDLLGLESDPFNGNIRIASRVMRTRRRLAPTPPRPGAVKTRLCPPLSPGVAKISQPFDN